MKHLFGFMALVAALVTFVLLLDYGSIWALYSIPWPKGFDLFQ